MKSAYIVALVVVGVVAFAGVAGAAAGVGPLKSLKGDLHYLIRTPEGEDRMAELDAARRAGKPVGDQSATTTDLTKIPQEKPEASKATIYTEVAETKQSGKVDNHLTVNNTLKSVSFCEKNMRTRQIKLNDVDIAQRIAYLASNDLMGKSSNGNSIGEVVCSNMPMYDPTSDILQAQDVMTTGTADGKPFPNNEYWVVIGAQTFAIDPTSNEIFIIDGFAGERVGPIGKLK